MMGDLEPMLSPREMSDRYRREFGVPLSVSYVAKLRSVGGGPAFTKLGHFVVYRWADVVAWAEARRSKPVASTAGLPSNMRTRFSSPNRGRPRVDHAKECAEAAALGYNQGVAVAMTAFLEAYQRPDAPKTSLADFIAFWGDVLVAHKNKLLQ